MARELHLGGSERQMTEIAKALDRSVFEPHIGCFRSDGMRGDELRDAGVPVETFPVPSFKSLAAISEARRLARYVREHGIRIVHTWDYPLTVYAVPVARMMTEATAVSSQRSHRDLIPRSYRPLMRLSDRFAHAIVVNCEFLRRHLAEGEHVPASKVHVCYNGIDLDRFRRADPGPHPLTIGTVCGLRPEKDLATLIEGFARVSRLSTQARLAIVGSGDELDGLQRLACDLQIRDAVHFEPATPNVTEWLSKMDVFVLPARSEALSNALMEAMACGCCAIASNVGGNPELIRPKETGLLFRAGDAEDLAGALRLAIDSPALRGDLAARAAAVVRENFSIAAAARRMGEVYSRIAGAS